ncbi:MAG: hypothetical protein OCC46_13075 [Pseudodesulfovibrio sp.]
MQTDFHKRNTVASILSTLVSDSSGQMVQGVVDGYLSSTARTMEYSEFPLPSVVAVTQIPTGEIIHRVASGINGEILCISNFSGNKILKKSGSAEWETVYSSDGIISRLAHNGKQYFVPLLNKSVIDVLDENFEIVETIDLKKVKELSGIVNVCNVRCDGYDRLICSGEIHRVKTLFSIDRIDGSYVFSIIGSDIITRNGDCVVAGSRYLLIDGIRILVADREESREAVKIVRSIPIPHKFLTILPWRDLYLVPLITKEIIVYNHDFSVIGKSSLGLSSEIRDLGLMPSLVPAASLDHAYLYGFQGKSIYTINLSDNKECLNETA